MAEESKKTNESNAVAEGAATAQTPGGGAPGSQPSGSGQAAQNAAPQAANPAAKADPKANNPNYEDGAISSKLPVISLTPSNETVTKLVAKLKEDELIRMAEAAVSGAPILARQLRPCMMIASIVQSTDVVKYLNMLKPLKDDLKANRIKFIVLSKINNPAIIATFEKAGCHEYIIEPINERSLFFKINLQTKALKAQRKKLRQEELRRIEDEKKGLEKGKDKKAADDAADGEEQIDKDVKTEEGNESEDDVWVFRGNKPKKAGGKWTMRMKGPDPSKGDWVPVEKTPDGKQSWRFMEKGEDPKSAKGKKGWEFTGEKPTFTNGEWNFNGEKPELSLVDEKGNKQFSKLKTDGKDGLVMAKDSAAALKKDEEREKQAGLDKEKKKKALFGGGPQGAEKNSDDEQSEEPGGKGANAGKDGEHKDKGKNGLNFADYAMGDDSAGAKLSDKTGAGDKKGAAGVNDKTGTGGKGAGAGSGKSGGRDGKGGEKPGDKLKELAQEANAKSEEKKEKQQAPWLKAKEEKEKKVEEEKAKKEGKESLAGGGAFKDKTGGPDKKDLGGRGIGQGQGQAKDGVPAARGPNGESLDARENSDGSGPAAGLASGAGAGGKATGPGAKERGKLGELAGMAMNFDDEKAGPNSKLGKQEETGPGGRNNAKTEHIKNSKWGGHDLTPEEMLKREEREKRQQALKESLAKRGKGESGLNIDVPEGEQGAEAAQAKDQKKAGEEDDKAASLGLGKKNFLKKKDGKGEFNDKSNTEDETQGGWSKHREEEEKKKRRMGARDSDQSGPEGDNRDQLVEIDQPKGTLTFNMMGDKVWEYPPDFFGSVNGTWEGAGNDNTDEQKRKCFIFLEPEIRMKKVEDVRTVKTWWIFHGDRPLFNVHKKVWFCKKYEPRKIEGFDKLPQVAQDFLLSVSPHVVMQKKKELEEKLKKARDEQAEQVKKAREEFKEQQSSTVDKKKKEEEEKKAAMEALRNLDAKDEKSSKQSHKYEEEEAKKKDKKGALEEGAGDDASAKKKKHKAEDGSGDEASAKDKSDKDKKKKDREQAELDAKAGEKEKKKKGDEDSAGNKENLDATDGGRKKKDAADGKLELEKTKKDEEKGKQSLEKDEATKGEGKLELEKAKKKEDEKSGAQKLEKEKEESDFKGEKNARAEDELDASKESGKHSHKHNRFEAELKIAQDDLKGGKKKTLHEDEKGTLNAKAEKKDEKSRKNLDVSGEEGDKGGAKSSRKAAGEEEESAKATLDKAAGSDGKLDVGDGDQGGEKKTLSPLDEALKDAAVVPLPSAPMMAVFVSELLISTKGDAVRVLDKFVRFLSQGCSGVGVSVFYLGQTAGENVVRVMASSHPHYPVGSQLSLTERPEFKTTIDNRAAHYPNPDGPLHVPINAAKGPGQTPIGLLVLEPLDSGTRFTKLVNYFQGVAQVLRSIVVSASKQIDSVKEAA